MPPPTPNRSRRPDRRRTVAIGLAVVGATAVWTAAGCAEPRPLVTFRQVVPDDVEAEAVAAVAAFRDRFAPRRGCIDGVEVVLVDDVVDGDARYVPAEVSIEIEIPTSPRRFRESLVHELAHHVEHTCPEFEPLRSAILASAGDTTWSGQRRWADRPSEQWAEAVVAITLGDRVRFGRTMPLDPALVEAVARWAAGD